MDFENASEARSTDSESAGTLDTPSDEELAAEVARQILGDPAFQAAMNDELPSYCGDPDDAVDEVVNQLVAAATEGLWIGIEEAVGKLGNAAATEADLSELGL